MDSIAQDKAAKATSKDLKLVSRHVESSIAKRVMKLKGAK
jgi:hypothetical protein